MAEEKIFADFSGGMNASVAVDKLPEHECLLAENVRFDEAGNVLISGANTAQNTSALNDGTNSAVHSLFYSESIGAIAGVGRAVYAGVSPSNLVQLSATVNTSTSKMSFGAGERRVYMDIGGAGYFVPISGSSLVTVDWEPPQASTAVVTGPQTVQTGTTTGTGVDWTAPAGVTGTASYAHALLTTATRQSRYLRCLNPGFALGTNAIQGVKITCTGELTEIGPGGPNSYVLLNFRLILNGAAVGDIAQTQILKSNPGPLTVTVGDNSNKWGLDLVPGDLNATNFGVQIDAFDVAVDGVRINLKNVQFTAYQTTTGAVAAMAAGGTMGSGTYSWKITNVADGGEESDASPATNTVTFTATRDGTLTGLVAGDSRTTARNVYRKGGSLTAYYFVGSVPDNVTTTFLDNTPDIDALATAVILAGDVPGDPPNSRLGGDTIVVYPTLHYQRLFWLRKNSNELVWSKPGNHFAYPATFSEPVGDAKIGTGLVSFGGELFIFKGDSIWRFSGTDEASFQLTKTQSPVGTDWPFTIAALTDRILFINRKGIWAFNGYTSRKIFGNKLDLWFLQDDRSNVSLFGTNKFKPPEIVSTTTPLKYDAKATPSHYYLAYAESGQSSPNAILVLDLDRGSITKRSFPAQSLAVEEVSGYFYAGHTAGIVVKLDDWAAANNGISAGAVNFDFQTGFRDLGVRGNQMALWGVEFLIDTGGQNVTPTAYFDESSTSEALTTVSSSGLQRVFRRFTSARSRQCRSISLLLNASSTAVNSSGKPSIQLNHIKLFYEARAGRARTGEKQ